MEKFLRTSGFTNEVKTQVADELKDFLLKTVPYYKRRVVQAQDTLPDQPTLPKEDEVSIKLKWNYQICMQEIEFHGMNLLSRLRHVEVNEGIVDTIMEEGEMPADEDEAAQP